jgi:hypothetical protein
MNEQGKFSMKDEYVNCSKCGLPFLISLLALVRSPRPQCGDCLAENRAAMAQESIRRGRQGAEKEKG